MIIRHSKMLLFGVCVLFSISTFGCGIRYMIQGQVLDAETGEPVEGAAVAIKWYEYKISAPYASGYNEVETAEDLTDTKGFFQLPKYSFKQYFMGVYKSGYVCWNSDTIFYPDRTSYEKRFEKRKGHEINNDMVVKLSPFRDSYPRDEHATYTVNVWRKLSIRGLGIFEKAIESEIQLDLKKFRRNIGKD